MSETTTKFEIEVDNETTLSRDSMVEHIEHGPMRVESIVVGAFEKRAQLQSELGPIGLNLSEDELREEWGETMHTDPFELGEPNSAQIESKGISIDDVNIEVSIQSVGAPQDDTEAVHMHAVDQVVRALQAVRDEQSPEECEGAEISIKWDDVFDN